MLCSVRLNSKAMFSLFLFILLLPASSIGQSCWDCSETFNSVNGGFQTFVYDSNGDGYNDSAYACGTASIMEGYLRNPYTGWYHCGTLGESAPLEALYNIRAGDGVWAWHQWSGIGDQYCDLNYFSCPDGDTYCVDTRDVCVRLNMASHYVLVWAAYCNANPCIPPCPRLYFGGEERYGSPPWDPKCPPCVGGLSNGICIHPTPARSMVYDAQPDVLLKSPRGDFDLKRTYRSSLAMDPDVSGGIFGKGWWSSIEYRVVPVYGSDIHAVMLVGPGGKKTLFSRNLSPWEPAVYKSQAGDESRIAKEADNSYILVREDGSTYHFDSAGMIQSITDSNDNSVTYQYVAGKLSSVIDKLGRVIFFEYGGTDYVTAITAPEVVAFNRDASGNLISVHYADSSGMEYDYADPDLPHWLTRVRSIKNGVYGLVDTRIEYDDLGRVTAATEGPSGRTVLLVYKSEQQEWYPGPEHEGINQLLNERWGLKYRVYTEVIEGTDTNSDLQISPGETWGVSTYYYDSPKNVPVVTKTVGAGCDCGASAETVYDDNFNVLEKVNNRGITSKMSYNEHGDIAELIEAFGTGDETVTTYQYVYPQPPVFPGQTLEKRIETESVVVAGSVRATVSINDPVTGNLIERREEGYLGDGTPVSYSTTFSYDVYGALQSIDGPLPGNGDVIRYEYYPSGHAYQGLLWKVIDTFGDVTTFTEYDSSGNVLRKIDQNGNATVYTYGHLDMAASETNLDGTTAYTYDEARNPDRITYPQGNSFDYEYGPHGLLSMRDEAGNMMVNIYAGGNKVREEVYNAANVLQRYEESVYNEKRKLWKRIGPDGSFEEYIYDEEGNVLQKKEYSSSNPDVLEKITEYSYDALSRVKTVSVTGTHSFITYVYDQQGNITSVTDSLGQVTLYYHDDFGRIFRQVSPVTGTTEYTYDAGGNLLSLKNAAGSVVNYAYDTMGRMIETREGTNVLAVYRYDDYSGGITSPNARGRRTEVQDNAGLKRFFYDHSGRVIRVEHALDTQWFDTSYEYDANGNITGITYPDGRVIRYLYYPQSNQVQSVKSIKDGLETVLADSVSRMPFGPVSSFTYGNNLQYTRDFDGFIYRPSSISVTDGATTVMGREYQYYYNGNISMMTEHTPGGAPVDNTYDYDPLGHLMFWDKPGHSISYQYDANGNRLVKAVDGAATVYDYDQMAADILVSTTGVEQAEYSHDDTGNITGWDAKIFEYDVIGRLIKASEGMNVAGTYTYNSEGQRIKKESAGETIYYQYDLEGKLIHESRYGGKHTIDYVFLGGEPLAMIETDNRGPIIGTGPDVIKKTYADVVIRWETDESCDSKVVFGQDESYGMAVHDTAYTTSHEMTITGLSGFSEYHFKVVSKDKYDNMVESPDMVFVTDRITIVDDMDGIQTGWRVP